MKTFQMENIGFRYEGMELETIKNISAEIPEGKITLVLGPSGSGKSTLINVLMHIAPEYHCGRVQGEFNFPNLDWKNSSLKQMAGKIGLVMQNSDSQFCSYTVEDELAFGLENLSVSATEMKVKIDNVLELLNIGHLRNRTLHSLSGGEKQRVAIGSVLTLDPPMVIFDEPTSNLDPVGMSEFFDIMMRLKDVSNKTILVVEHQMEELYDKVDKLLLLNGNGQLIFSGPPEHGLKRIVELEDSEEMDIHLPPAMEFYGKLKDKPPYFLRDCRDVAGFLTRLTKPRHKKSTMSEDEKSTKPIEVCDGDSVLECENLSISFGGERILKGINLSVNSGEILAIVGPNGSGKTTLMHSMLGIYGEAEGVIKLLQRHIKKKGRKKWNHVGISFQNPEWQFVADTVEGEILYSIEGMGLSEGKREVLLKECLDMFDLWEKRKLNPFLLSQGEKRRLSVASVMIKKQDILVLDEPTFGQDLKNQRKMLNMIRDLNDKGVTIVIITHNMDVVYEYADRVVLVKSGEIKFDGLSHDLFNDDELCEIGRLRKPFWFQVSKELQEVVELRSSYEAVERYSI